jgi:glycosyltransferase involved in cell wall biosynthesis
MRLVQIANHFGGRYHHTIFAQDGVYDAMKAIGAHVPVATLSAPFDKRRGLANLPAMRRMMREAQAAVAITYNWGAIEWALAGRLVPGLSLLHIEDGFGPDEAQGQLPRRVWFRWAALGTGRTQVVVPSRVLEDISLNVWKLPRAKVHLIANGIDLSRFASTDAAEAAAFIKKTPGEILIGTVATLRPEKNLGLLVRAFAMLPADPPTRLVIAGAGGELERLKAAARDAGVAERVTFLGHVAKPEMVLKALDVFAMSSSTEQMPISLLEAMACGLPAAATTVGDIAHMVAAENAPLLTAPGSAEALSAALGKLVMDTTLRHAVGARNLARVKATYDQDVMFQRYAALFG